LSLKRARDVVAAMDAPERPRLRRLVAALGAVWLGCAEGSIQSGSGDDGAADVVSVDPDATMPEDRVRGADDADLPPTRDAAAEAADVGFIDAGFVDAPDAPPDVRPVSDVPAPLDRAVSDVAAVDVASPDVVGDVCAGLLCTGACVDPASDPRHCGGCGRVCPPAPHVRPGAMRCLASSCTFAPSDCEPGFGDCDTSAANGCESDLGRPTTCGACGIACAEPTPNCVLRGTSSVCESGCAAGFTRCGGACVITSTDVNHCGACDNRCPTPPGGLPVCESGRCSAACPAGTHACGTSCVSDRATATCGTSCTPCPAPTNGTATCDGVRCGVACNAGTLLVGGACVRAFCGAGVVACPGGSGCPPNSACTAGGGCLCNAGFQAVTCAGVACTSCPGVDFFCTPAFCGGGTVLCRDGGYCPANSTCSPDSSACLCNPGRRAVTCAGVACTPCVYPGWRCI
jgi:hypothetical protein